MDTFFQFLAAFLKNGKELKNLLKVVRVVGSSLLVTADVESLYTNIKQKDALDDKMVPT